MKVCLLNGRVVSRAFLHPFLIENKNSIAPNSLRTRGGRGEGGGGLGGIKEDK